MNLLEVDGLRIWKGDGGEVLVHDSHFYVKEGSCLGIVGASGSGKSLTIKAIMGLNPSSIQQTGSIRFKGEELSSLSQREWRRKRGRQMCLIMQNGMKAFDPSRRLKTHSQETLSEHTDWGWEKGADKVTEAMSRVLLQDPEGILEKYPHQLSGGMLQRVMIALALVLEPDLIIADEPTTALDAISQFEVVEQLTRLKQELGCSMIFISHDLGIVKRLADEVLVMNDGIIVEKGSTEAIFNRPEQEYTQYLISTRRALSLPFQRVMGREHPC